MGASRALLRAAGVVLAVAMGIAVSSRQASSQRLRPAPTVRPLPAARVVPAPVHVDSALAVHTEPAELSVRDDALPPNTVRPASLRTAMPVAIYMHGIHGDPRNGCPYFQAITENAWLLCPWAPVSNGEGHASWSDRRTNQRVVDRAIASLVAAAPEAVNRDELPVLIGFSQGAYAIREMLRGNLRTRALVLIGANVPLSRATLLRAGVQRVVFAAGRSDGTYRQLRAAARALQSERFPARFLDLGAVGHSYVPTAQSEGWQQALRWVATGT